MGQYIPGIKYILSVCLSLLGVVIVAVVFKVPTEVAEIVIAFFVVGGKVVFVGGKVAFVGGKVAFVSVVVGLVASVVVAFDWAGIITAD